MRGLIFGIALASVGVAALAGSAVAQRVIGHGSHGAHGGAGPAWPTPVPSDCRPVPNLQGGIGGGCIPQPTGLPTGTN